MAKLDKNSKKAFSISSLFKHWFGRYLLLSLIIIVILGGAITTLTVNKKNVQAVVCTPCVTCSLLDTMATTLIMNAFEDMVFEPLIKDNIEDHIFHDEGNWIVQRFFARYWLKALAELTEFLSAFGMYQIGIVGTFFDAKNVSETQQLFFKLQAEAHKDYHPSDDFCWFGTNSRSMAATESRANLNMLAMSKRSLQRQLGHKNSASAKGAEDKNSRWKQFINTYCDPKDNSWNGAGTGLDLACDHDGIGGATLTGALDSSRVNRDIDYTRLIDEPRTLNVNFTDDPITLHPDEEDVLAMASNLYGNDTLSRRISRLIMDKPEANRLYMDLRSIAAKRNVAENSYNAIISMKSAGTNGDPNATQHPDVGLYMAALMKDLMPAGVDDSDVLQILGENPSYYAQLEFLGKKIYQNPDFFANLYDKPANVKRKSVAMKAISLMIDRALFESELRQEMLLSVMLSNKLSNKYKIINRDLKLETTR